jgi:putative aldouronate transport system permease protein
MPPIVTGGGLRKRSLAGTLRAQFARNKHVLLMLTPVVLYYLLFHYQPMYGAQIAFKDFSPVKGIWNSPWAGFKHFLTFFNSYYAERVIWNTILLNLYDIVLGFPAPIVLALLLNEIKNNLFKGSIQTITYLPHFISLVVVSGIILDFLARDGVANQLLGFAGVEPIPFMLLAEWFRPVYVVSGIWQNVGWASIIYLAALSGINPELYEAAKVDGAGRWRQMLNVTLPGLAPTIVIMLILRLGRMMDIGLEKVLLLYNPSTYSTADVISTFVFRKGMLEMSYSYSTAVELFNSVINFTMLVLVNRMSRKISDSSLW